jgi:CubicO group peptidase (beta-lactamase class C family)
MAEEIIHGVDLQDILQETLCVPLDMPDTVFRLAFAKGHRVAEPSPASRAGPPYFLDPCRPRRGQRGGGGLVSTARDYARFVRMLLGNSTLDGCRLLSPATVDLMTADHLGIRTGKAPLSPRTRLSLRARPCGPAVARRGAVSWNVKRLLLEGRGRHIFLGGSSLWFVHPVSAPIGITGTAAAALPNADPSMVYAAVH